MMIPSFDKDKNCEFKAIKALVAPVRMRLFCMLEEPHTVREIADKLKMKRGSVYHHLRVLEDAGLVERVGETKIKNLSENHYQSVENPAFDKQKMLTQPSATAFQDIIRGIASLTSEDCLRSMAQGEENNSPGKRFSINIREDDLEEIPKRIRELSNKFEHEVLELNQEDGTSRYSVTVLHFEMLKE